MSSLRTMKKGKKAVSPLDPKLMATWNQGFSAGVKQQRESDIENMLKLLEGLEEIPGIGEKIAWKIREHFLKRFGN